MGCGGVVGWERLWRRVAAVARWRGGAELWR